MTSALVKNDRCADTLMVALREASDIGRVRANFGQSSRFMVTVVRYKSNSRFKVENRDRRGIQYLMAAVRMGTRGKD